MTVSMNLHDCLARESWRDETARLIRDFERRNGRKVKTQPIIARAPETRVDIVINAEREEKRRGKK